jgi:hypothetical protein
MRSICCHAEGDGLPIASEDFRLLLPAPTGLSPFLKGPRELGIGGCLINVTGPDGITIFPKNSPGARHLYSSL